MINNNKNNLIDKKNETIINGAIKIFIKKGFDNATIDEIIKEAKVGKGTIYRRIGNKEKLEQFVIKQIGSLMFSKIKERLKKNKNNPLLQFKEIINIMCDFFDDKPQIAMLFYSRIFFNPKKPNITKHWPPIPSLKTENFVENIFKKAIKEKQIKNINIQTFLKGFTYFCNPFYFNFLKKTMMLTKSEISVMITDYILNGIAIKQTD